MSKMGHTCNPNMLIESLTYWKGSTNTFRLCCGMATPTLFDIVAITSLLPTGETYDPTMIINPKPIFSFDRITYKNFVEVFCDTNSEEAYD